MNVSVSFHGIQRKILRQSRIDVKLQDEARVSDLLHNIRQTYPQIALDENAMVITVNDHVSSVNQSLQLNDHISLIPHLGGG